MLGPGSLILLLATLSSSYCEDVQKTKVFVLTVEPGLFNWTNAYNENDYLYRASLLGSPDLPEWMSYHYSKRHRKGFIYGVPPLNASDVQVQVIGLNRENYASKLIVIPVNVTEKPDTAKYEIHLKIDNLNIEDMFESHRVFNLLRIFTTVLWPESADHLYMTNLESAIKLGARRPLLPHEGEGVVIHLGSSRKFSGLLELLEQEVLPLRRITTCPRDFKRSSVDRHFRPSGFIIDWCSFRLVTLETKDSSSKAPYNHEPPPEGMTPDLIRRDEIPRRDYSSEILNTLIVPTISLLALITFLSVILCVEHDNITDPESESFFGLIFIPFENYYRGQQYRRENETTFRRSTEPVQRQQCNLREGSPRMSVERDDARRPSPPPYSATKRMELDS